MAKEAGEANLSVAERSSAIDEDADQASFAGQHDTYLNISGVEAILDAVVRCRESACSPQALAYREQQGLSVEDIRIGILVQQLGVHPRIASEMLGHANVAFTMQVYSHVTPTMQREAAAMDAALGS